MDALCGFKVFNCENFLPGMGYPEISRCTVLAETAEVALGLALEQFPKMPHNNWTVDEVKLTGRSQVLFDMHESH